jgi:multiple sugar transport system permease protein
MKQKHAFFRSFVGICVLIGWITPEIVCAFCWITFLDPDGTLNAIVQKLLEVKQIAFLYSFPMISVIVANIWHGTAFSMLQFQAGLDNIPVEVEEAAALDGASGLQKIFYITVPMVKGTIVTDLILVTLATLGVFGLIYTMTAGGPGTQTTTLSIFMYKVAFINFQLGYGTAISLILLLIGMLLSLLYLRFSNTKL